MNTPVSILPSKNNKFSLNLMRASVAALVAVAFMGWGSSYAQLITSSPGGASAAPSTQKSGGSAAKNKQATEELISIAKGWCALSVGEQEDLSAREEVRRLLAAGADINAADHTGATGATAAEPSGTALMYAVKEWMHNTAKFLIEQGANINAVDDGGRTALMWALVGNTGCYAMRGSVGVDARSVRLLLEKGANPKVAAKDGTTALSIAARNKKLSSMVKAAIDNYGSGKKLELNSGIDAVDANEETALMRAVYEGDVAGVKSLLEKGADADIGDADGYTPLMRAVEKGNMPIIEALLRHGADVNAKDYRRGASALLLAVEGGRADIVKLLLDKKSKIDGGIYDAPCYTSLFTLAVLGGNADIVKLLIGAGADVNEDITGGMCSFPGGLLEAAKEHPEIVRMLKAAGAKEKPAGD